jgi:hypothetical protein
MTDHEVDFIAVLLRTKVYDVVVRIEVSIWGVLVGAEGEMVVR